MRRIALTGAFVLVAAVTGLVVLPLSAALNLAGGDRLGLSATAAQGSVWNGRLTSAKFRGVSLGDLDVGADPLALLTGRLKLRLAADGGVLGRGTISATGNSVRIEDLSGESALSALGRGLPVSGTLTLTDLSAAFEGDRCMSAQGRAEVASQAAVDIPAAVPPLSGQIRCEDGALLLPLSGQGPAGAIALNLSLLGDGLYRSELRLRPADPALAAALRRAGFHQDGADQVRITEGRAFR